MNALDYYVLLLDEDGKMNARGREGRRAFIGLGMDRATHETWLLLRNRPSADMTMFALPSGDRLGVKHSCFRAMVGRLADGKNLFVNTSGDRVMVNVYSPNFAQLLDEIDRWLDEDAVMVGVYRRFGMKYEPNHIQIELGELPESLAFGMDISRTFDIGDVQLIDLTTVYLRFVDEDTADWTEAAEIFVAMYDEFLTNGFYDIKTVEIQRAKIEQEIVNDFARRVSGYVYDETGPHIDSFLNSFFGKTLHEYIKDLADFDFEWQLGKHLPEANVLDPLFDGGLRMSVNPSDDEDVAARAKEIAAAVVELYNKHWSGEIALPAYDQPRLEMEVE